MRKIKTSILLFFLLAPLVTFGENGGGLVPCGGPEQEACQICHIFDLFAAVVYFLLTTIVPPLATIFFVWGGVRFYTAMGDPEKITSAKKVLSSVIIGLVIVYSAYFLVTMILGTLGAKVDGLQVEFCE